MNLLGHLPGGYNDWRVTVGAATHLGRAGVALLVAAAAVAIALSALSLADERRGRGVLLFALRVAGVLACLLTALEPTVELRQVTHVPNRVAVLVDASRSMEVRPPDGGPSRAERAAALIDAAAPELAALQRDGHDVDLYAFADALTPATRESLHAAPAGDATRIGEALGELRARYAGRDLGAVLLISDGVDTGRIGEGPLDATTRTTIEAMGAPIHTVGLGRKVAARSVDRDGAGRRARVRPHAGDHRSGRSAERAAGPAGRGHAGARRPASRDPRRDPARRQVRGEGLVRLAAGSPGQLRVSDLDAGAGRRGAVQQQPAVVHAEGDPRPRPRAAPGRPSVVGRAFLARDAAARSQRRPGVVLHPAHGDRRAALEPRRSVVDPVPDVRDLRRTAALVRSGDLPELQLRALRRRAVLAQPA